MHSSAHKNKGIYVLARLGYTGNGTLSRSVPS